MTDSWKNIDLVFKDKFNKFEAEPPPHVWENIKSEIGINPGGTPPSKGNGGLSSLLIFIVVLLLVSFISPKTKTDLSNESIVMTDQISDNSYYSQWKKSGLRISAFRHFRIA